LQRTEIAYNAGILPKQAQEIVDFFNKSVGAQIEGTRQEQELQAKKLTADLQQEWGSDYERNMKLAETAFGKFLPEGLESAEELKAQLMSRPETTLGKSVDDLKAERDTLYSDPAFLRNSHPLHAAKMKRFMELNTAIAGTGHAEITG